METEPPRHDITGVILAGGRGRRMGGADKGLVTVRGRRMIEYVLDALRPQVGTILINANRNLDDYRALGVEVVPDTLDGYLGPLAGLASAMPAARTPYLVSVPCDSPLLAPDLVARLYDALARADADIAMAHDGGRAHPVFALLKRDLLDSLRDYLAGGGRKVDLWFAQHRLATAYFPDRLDAFVNVNDPAEHAAVEARFEDSASC